MAHPHEKHVKHHRHAKHHKMGVHGEHHDQKAHRFAFGGADDTQISPALPNPFMPAGSTKPPRKPKPRPPTPLPPNEFE